MAQNILKEIQTITAEILRENPTSYQQVTKTTLKKLGTYIQGGSWTDNETEKFVAKYFIRGLKNLPDLYKVAYPTKEPKGYNALQTNFQKINNYLGSVLPDNLFGIFTGENMPELLKISQTVDTLYLNDAVIESALGERLLTGFQSLPFPEDSFSVDECETELKAVSKLMQIRYEEIMKDCDEKKLSYIYYVLSSPSFQQGKLNRERLQFIEKLLPR